MRSVRRTEGFDRWLLDLRDRDAAGRIVVAVQKLAFDLGDIAPVGAGVSEVRLNFGPGYRLYFVGRGKRIIILLCGGDKTSQKRDIRTAKAMAKDLT
jgi:putative addiction module killer protein